LQAHGLGVAALSACLSAMERGSLLPDPRLAETVNEMLDDHALIEIRPIPSPTEAA
jgi:hypothetical protein